MWTRFLDMHTGDGCKVDPYETILIEAPREQAIRAFRKKFNRDPLRESCCDDCGPDYFVTEGSLERLTAYPRSQLPKRTMSVADFIKRKSVLVIEAAEVATLTAKAKARVKPVGKPATTPSAATPADADAERKAMREGVRQIGEALIKARAKKEAA